MLKPQIFALSEEEKAAQLKAYMAAAAESDKAFDQVLDGKFEIINSNVKAFGAGDFVHTRGKEGGTYYVELNIKDAPMKGIAVRRKASSYEELWVAFAPQGAVALCVYEIDGTKLNGTWYPINGAKDGATVNGAETLTAEKTPGTYKITTAKGPNGGAEYTGTLTAKPYVPADGNSTNFAGMFQLTWTLGKTKLQGVGVRVKGAEGKDVILAAAGAGKEGFGVGHVYCESATSIKALDFLFSDGKSGYINLTRPAQ
ncbi:MAG: hypothetical protein QM811_26285 [Pirellulales bacterium]